MRKNIDISLFSETKLGEAFPNQQFKVSGYKMFRRTRNKHGGGNLFCIFVTVNVEGLPKCIKSRK